ncbi:MAG: hypothetical protein ACTHK7_12795 [Aureliella sp.]
MTFKDWLLSRDIDAEALTPELEGALWKRFQAEQKATEPPGEVLLLLSDERYWPVRCERVSA